MILYICGSFKHYDPMLALKNRCEENGIQTLLSAPNDPQGIAGCFGRIDQCDVLYVFNPDGGVGKSVSVDLGYAIAKKKILLSHQEVNDPPLKTYFQKVVSPDELVVYFQNLPVLTQAPKSSSYAVIFTSLKPQGGDGYEAMAKKMEAMSSVQTGFMGMHSARNADGLGITVSYWRSLVDIASWKANAEHREAQRMGKSSWYEGYEVRICKVERQYGLGTLE